MEANAVILLVDDEEPVLNALERSLRLDGHRILKTTDPLKALEILETEPVEVIISDQLMPGIKGVDLLQRAHAVRPNAVRILLTGHADLQLALSAINQGHVYRFFTKPWDDAALRLDVRLAVENMRLKDDNRRLTREIAKRDAMLTDLEKHHPGITALNRAPSGAIQIDDEDF